MKKQSMNKHYQKQSIKKEYAAARNAGSQTAGTATKNTGKKLGEKVSDKIKEFFEKNKKVFIWIGIGIALLVLLGAGISSCSMLTSTGSSVIASSYLSEDDAMLGAEAQYCQMEQELQRYLDTYESTHNYDEYHFDLDDIEHDPYVLISILSALHEGEFTLDEVQGTLQMLFEKQYILTEEVIVETRYRTETDTWTDADGNTHTETYRVPYDYYICNVKLENFNLSHVPVYIMSQEQLSMYATYMSVLGNREDLFGDSPYQTYFLNMVDESDLLALLDDDTAAALTTCNCKEKCAAGQVNTDCPVCKTNMSECTGTAPVTPEPDKDAETDTPAPKPEKKSNVGMILVIFALAGAAGAAYYPTQTAAPCSLSILSVASDIARS